MGALYWQHANQPQSTAPEEHAGPLAQERSTCYLADIDQGGLSPGDPIKDTSDATNQKDASKSNTGCTKPSLDLGADQQILRQKAYIFEDFDDLQEAPVAINEKLDYKRALSTSRAPPTSHTHHDSPQGHRVPQEDNKSRHTSGQHAGLIAHDIQIHQDAAPRIEDPNTHSLDTVDKVQTSTSPGMMPNNRDCTGGARIE